MTRSRKAILLVVVLLLPVCAFGAFYVGINQFFASTAKCEIASPADPRWRATVYVEGCQNPTNALYISDPAAGKKLLGVIGQGLSLRYSAIVWSADGTVVSALMANPQGPVGKYGYAYDFKEHRAIVPHRPADTSGDFRFANLPDTEIRTLLEARGGTGGAVSRSDIASSWQTVPYFFMPQMHD